MTNQSEARRLFAEIVNRKEEDVELAKAALLFAKEEYPDLDIDKYLEKIDLMAEEIKRRIGYNTDPYLTTILSVLPRLFPTLRHTLSTSLRLRTLR